MSSNREETGRNTFGYRRGEDGNVDREFKMASGYGKVKLGQEYIFWKKGFTWSMLELSSIKRIYRKIEGVDTKMCCGNVNFDIQKLVFLLRDGNGFEVLIGEGMLKEADALYRKLKDEHPEIQYGKP